VLPALSVAGARVAHPAPFPLPAHRTGQADFPQPALRRVSPPGTRARWRPSPEGIAPSAAAAPLWEFLDHAVNLLALGYFHNVPEVRPLPSTGVTRLQRYYEPVRHPRRPGLSLAGVQLGVTSHRWGFPCCVRSPAASMSSPLPRWDPRRDRVAPLDPGTTAFPIPLLGRLPHLLFRGLRSVHACYGLLARGIARGDPFHRRLR
jgi:hypothetical protein